CRATQPLADRLRAKLRALRPRVVYVPHEQEMHPDHRAAVRLVRLALAGWRGPRPEVLAFEVWTPLQRMDHVEDISPYVDVKLAAVRAYASQCRVLRFDDAVL